MVTVSQNLFYNLLLYFLLAAIQCNSIFPFTNEEDTTSTVNEYDTAICGDTFRRTKSNSEIRMSNDFENLHLYQYGNIWQLNNRSFPINVACTLHLSICPACILELIWNGSYITSEVHYTKNLTLLIETCYNPRGFM